MTDEKNTGMTNTKMWQIQDLEQSSQESDSDRSTFVIEKEEIEAGYEPEYEPSYGELRTEDLICPKEPGKEVPPELQFHESPRKRKKYKKSHRSLHILIAIAVVLGVFLFLRSPVFTIKNFDVEGNHYYSDHEVVNIATAQTGVNLFKHSEKRRIKKQLLKNPYYTDVKFGYHLPSTLVIKVKERTQTAAIKFGDQYVVINQSGRVLRITDVKPQITILKGLTLSRITLNKQVKAEESGTLQYMLDMIATMKKGDFYFREIDMSGVIVKAYVTKTLVVKCSASQLRKAVASGNLQKVVNKLFKSKIYRGTISIGKENYMYYSPSVS